MNRRLRRAVRRPKVLLAAVVLGLVAALTACGGGSSTSGNNEIKWAIDLATTWDPVTAQIGWDIFALNIPHEGLTQISKDGKPLPGLAESWQYNGDGTEITFTLRPGQKFTDGEPVNAEAVKFDIERKKTQADSKNKELLQTVATVEAVSDLEVKFVLSQPDY